MAVSRRQTETLAHEVRNLLNRPEEDDLIVFPERYYEALSKAHRHYHRQVAQHAPQLLSVVEVKTSSDGGETYDLEDHHFGELELWEPPGPPNGLRIYPALPESSRIGFYVQGTSLVLTRVKDYSPGLYVRWTPATVADIDAGTQHLLPAYCEDAMIARAAMEIAETPGVLADSSVFREKARREWRGDEDDPSDMGVLGILKRLAANEGIVTAAGLPGKPWYRGIG